MKFFFLFVLISTFTYAQEESCDDNLVPQTKNLAEIAKQLNWKAVSDHNIRNAFCKRNSPFSSEEMTKWLKENQSLERKNKSIYGINFVGESPENLSAFELLTTARSFFGRVDPKNQKTFNSACQKVECAVKEIFGPKTGIQLLFMQQKFGMNGSHLVLSNRSSWKSSELDHVLLALSDFPPGLLPAESNRSLTHFKRGYLPVYASENTIANATIEVFDLWDEVTPEEKRYAITHELGHNLGGLAGRADESSKWMKMSGWTAETKVENGEKITKYKSANPQAIISKYGLTNPAEDFAESVAAYRYNPKMLKSVSPEKYNFIKEIIFDNIEYTSEEACKNPKRLSESYVKKAESLISKWEPSPIELKNISIKCSELAVSELSAYHKVSVKSSKMKTCYEKAINSRATEIAREALKDNPNSSFLGPVLKNVKLKPIPDVKMATILKSTQNVHRDLLRSSLKTGINSQYNFGPNAKKENLQYFYQSIPESIGFNPFSKKNEFQNIAYDVVKSINNNESLRRLVNISFSEKEIEEQLNKMIP